MTYKTSIKLKFFAINASGLSAQFQESKGGPCFDLPMSLIEFDDSKHNTVVSVDIPKWLAKNEGLVR